MLKKQNRILFSIFFISIEYFFVKSLDEMVFLSMCCDEFFQFISIGSTQISHFILVFHENKCWHCLDAIFSSNVFSLVHVDFEEHNVGHAGRPLLEFRCNHFAGSTPSGEKVNHYQLVSSRCQLAVEFVQASNFVNHFAILKCLTSLVCETRLPM